MTNTGFLLIDKPAGMTSHDVVDAVRRVTGERRVGHAGTLDPFATGLLIIGVGRAATARLGEFLGLDKTYEATIALGATSTTDDPEGIITPLLLKEKLEEQTIKLAIQSFVGKIEQVPPAYAAIKIQGKKMYELARAGKVVEAKPRTVTISSFELIGPIGPITNGPILFRVKIHCSSGTYIRALARDLGAKLGVGGYLTQLRRTAIGSHEVKNAVTLDQLQRQDWIKMLKNLGVDETPRP